MPDIRRKNREKNGFYSTREIFTDWLCENEEFEGDIYEPACGDGRMSRRLMHHGYRVISTDLIDRGFGTGGIDFLKTTKRHYNIVTNPPFDHSEEFIHHALKLARRKVAMIEKVTFLASNGRFHRLYDVTPPTRVYIVAQRTSMFKPIKRPNGKMVAINATDYIWLVWDKQDKTKQTEMIWLRPKEK